VNNAGFPVKVDPGRTNEYQTGTLTAKGSGSDYYYVLDTNGTQLASNKLNQPLSFPAGNYSVKAGSNTRAATVIAGQSAVVNW
jgi:C4-dicarboxylate-specific signal transduction histidine kinase